MDAFLIVGLGAAIFVAIALLVAAVARLRAAADKAASEQAQAVGAEMARLQGALSSLQASISSLQQGSDQRLEALRGAVDAKLGETVAKSGEAFQGMLSRLGDLKASNDRIVEISKDLASLQSILASPKLRGNFGEFALDQLLSLALPADSYSLQADLGRGVKVDVAVRLKEGVLPIDAKFPLETWRKLQSPNQTEEALKPLRRQFRDDVKKHVRDIADKYIQPGVTLDFALMFIPAEGVYHDLIGDSELHEFALGRRVYPVSPTTLSAMFQALAVGFRGMRLEQEASRVADALGGLQKDFERFKGEFDVLGKHLQNASMKFSEAALRMQRFDATLGALKLGKIESPPPAAG